MAAETIRPAATSSWRDIAGAIEERFPGAMVWHGSATGSWWAWLPGGRFGRFLEAASPEQLGAVLRSEYGEPGRRRPGEQSRRTC